MKIIILGDPIPKKRARQSRVNGFMMTYDPQQKEKERVKKEMIVAYNEALHSANHLKSIEAAHLAKVEQFVVNFTFHMPINKTDKLYLKSLKKWGLCSHTAKPDCSNLIKFYEDCANGILFKDDSQITSGSFIKKFSKNPRTEIEIMEDKKIKIHKKVEEILKIFDPDEFKNFLDQIHFLVILKGIDLEDITSNSVRHDYLQTVAYELNKFSKAFAAKLTKISKIDLPKENSIGMEGKPLC